MCAIATDDGSVQGAIPFGNRQVAWRNRVCGTGSAPETAIFVAAGKPESSDYQLGDLDIPASGSGGRVQRPAQPQPARPQPFAADALEQQNVDAFGDRDLGNEGFDGAMFGDQALELDESAKPRPAARAKTAPRSNPAPAPAAAAGTPRVRSHGNAAMGSSVPKDANPNVLTALQEIGGFGDPPTGLVSSGRYAIHVGLRLLALRKERRRILAALQQAEGTHRTSLEQLGETLLAHGSTQSQALKTFVDAVGAAQSQVSQADQSLSQAREETRGALAELEKTRQALEQEVAPFIEGERVAQAAVRKAEEDVRRAQAGVKRVEIELRALAEATTPANPAKVAELEKLMEEREEAVEGFQAALGAVKQRLTEAQRELAVKRGAVDAVDAQRRSLESGAQAKESAIGKQTHAAGEAYRTALRGLAEAARERGLAVGPASQADERVEETATALDEARSALDYHDRARHLYDHAGARQGTVLLVVIVVLGILLLLMHPGFDSH